MSTLSHQPAQKPPPPHAISLILSNEENENVFRALQPRCQSQATAVVEVYFTMAANPQVWSKLGVGIAAFVKDNSRRSYFIQVFDVEVCTQQTHNLPPLLMEQEIYREFIYTVSKESFHQFEGDERIIGLNFADDEEAWLFSTAVQNLLTGRQRRRDERKREAMLNQQKLMLQQQQEQQYQEKVSQHRLQQQQQQDLKEQQQSKSSKYRTIRGMKKLMDKYGNPYKEKPRRLEIGRPTDFKHISHAGLDSVFNINPDIEELLKNIGVDNQEMSEPKTQRYVMHFIENVGGMEEVRKMNRKLSTHRGGVESYRLPVSKPSSAHRLSRGFPDIEEDRSPSSSFNMPPPEAPPTLPPEYSTYRPPVPPRDTPSGTSLPNAPVPPPPRSVSHHSNHGKMLSLYSSKATPNEGHQRFPTTPSGRQLPVIQNAPGPGHSRPSQAYSKSGTPRSPHSPPIEAFSPPSPLLPRGFAPPPHPHIATVDQHLHHVHQVVMGHLPFHLLWPMEKHQQYLHISTVLRDQHLLPHPYAVLVDQCQFLHHCQVVGDQH
ncbi:actin nucleation-promoting factor WASL-like [Macrobrachium rosenbergii]|uniref:actin nucleation-promoting factor WASL-like n=1 Tax=Macrobrachium rosenbergii TaxID=79674 RepID=UPI0034D607DB